MKQIFWRFRHFWSFMVGGFKVLFGLPDDENATRDFILLQVELERERQLKKWGDQHHPNGSGPDGTLGDVSFPVLRDAVTAHNEASGGGDQWVPILLEEVFEACSETDEGLLRRELIQVCAVAVAWIEDLDSVARSK